MAEANETTTTETPATTTTAEADDLKALKERLDFLEKDNKQIIKDRDKAKGELKKIADEKAIKNGDYEKLLKEKEDALTLSQTELAEAKTYKEKLKKIEADTKKELLEQIEDKDLKKLAEKYDIEDLKVLVSKIGKKAIIADNGNGQHFNPKGKEKTTQELMATMYKK